MNAKPKVSIVVPYYRGLEHLPALLESIEAQEYPLDRLELILVMNGADDGALDLVNSRFPWVRTVDPGENLGYGGGCNLGAREAKGEWVAFLNTDMRVDSKWLTELLAATERHPDSVCFGSAILSWNGKRIDFCRQRHELPGGGLPALPRWGRRLGCRRDRQELFVCGGGALHAPRRLPDVGGFDEDFWAYYEDVDLGWRPWVLGTMSGWCPPRSYTIATTGPSAAWARSVPGCCTSATRSCPWSRTTSRRTWTHPAGGAHAGGQAGLPGHRRGPRKFISRTPPHAVAPSGASGGSDTTWMRPCGRSGTMGWASCGSGSGRSWGAGSAGGNAPTERPQDG